MFKKLLAFLKAKYPDAAAEIDALEKDIPDPLPTPTPKPAATPEPSKLSPEVQAILDAQQKQFEALQEKFSALEKNSQKSSAEQLKEKIDAFIAKMKTEQRLEAKNEAKEKKMRENLEKDFVGYSEIYAESPVIGKVPAQKVPANNGDGKLLARTREEYLSNKQNLVEAAKASISEN